MKTGLLQRFEKLLKDNYIFHLHTNYTDGRSSVEDYCLWAYKNGYGSIVFTEHVRSTMLYSFNDFLTQIENARQKFPNIDIWTGAEAKILPDGKLDIPDDIAREIEVICFACHSSQKNISLYEESLKQVFSDIRWKEHVRVWVHPGLFLKRFKLLDSYFSLLSELVSFAIAEGVFIEYNLRYDLPPMSIAKKVPLLGLVSGLDAHSVDEAGKLVLMREKWIGNN